MPVYYVQEMILYLLNMELHSNKIASPFHFKHFVQVEVKNTAKVHANQLEYEYKDQKEYNRVIEYIVLVEIHKKWQHYLCGVGVVHNIPAILINNI